MLNFIKATDSIGSVATPMALDDDNFSCPFRSGSLVLDEGFLQPEACKLLLVNLLEADHWNGGYYEVSGRRFSMPRVQTWYADDGVVYNFSYELHQQRRWTPLLSYYKQEVEKHINVSFNSVLINWYRNGSDWVDWHSDDEIELGLQPVIASLSLGASRKFYYRDKVNQKTSFIDLKDGSLLIMNPDFQKNWQHCIAREPNTQDSRVNLTFRSVVMP